MDTAQFLAQVIAPGNFLCVNYKSAKRPMGQRMFRRCDVAEAAGFIRWADGMKMDTYIALASFKIAEAHTDKHGNTYYKGERTQQNCDSLKCFWYDCDVSRPGDGKKPREVFDTLQDAQSWAGGLSLPPNMWVCSGYGMHFYWVLEEALSRDDWLPRAHQFKAYLIANGARGDIGITTDCARILRPPETRNWKVPDHPTAVKGSD